MGVCCAHCVYHSDHLFTKHHRRLLSQLAPRAPIAILDEKRVWKTRRRSPARHRVPGGRGRPGRPSGNSTPVEAPPSRVARPLKIRPANASRSSTGPWSVRLVTDHPSTPRPVTRPPSHDVGTAPGPKPDETETCLYTFGRNYTPSWHPKRDLHSPQMP